MLAIMDDRLLRIMRRWFNFPFEPLGPPVYFMGDYTTPVSMYMPATIERLNETSAESLEFFSGDISLAELDEVAIDLRESVAEHKSTVIDLRTAQRVEGW